MNNMLTRAISGAVFVSLLVFSIQYHPLLFAGLFYLFMMVSIFEFSRMLQIKNKSIYLIATFLFASHILTNCNINSIYLDTLAYIGVLFLFITTLFSKKSEPIKDLGNIFLCLAYTCVPYILLSEIPFINTNHTYESILILGVFIMIWSNDTFAYLTGMSIGKHKLIERISPKKTIEGFVGGVLATLIVSYFISLKFEILSTQQWMVLGVIVSIFGVIGDLIASMFKRQTGVKDTGNIIPGHGGILDRLDSIIFAAPFIYLYLKFITEHVS